MTLYACSVLYTLDCRHKADTKFLLTTIEKVEVMGAILDLTEMLKEPSGLIGLAVVVAAGYFLVKWVFAEHKEDEEE